MDTINVLNYLEKRELGYRGLKKKLSYNLIDKIGCVPQSYGTRFRNIGNTFACKFSRNKNNLHVVGCSTEYGEIIVLNSNCHYNDESMACRRNKVHANAIFNFAWAEPQMNLITACGDQSTKLFNVLPSGTLDGEREFMYGSSVKCVMFCPGSSNVFCGGSQDGSIKIWDARVNNGQTVLEFEHNIPNTHGIYESMSKKKKSRKIFGVSSVIFKTDQTIMSCSSMDNAIKLWDLRKSYRQVNGKKEPLPLTKYFNGNKTSPRFNTYTDIIINPESTLMYASCIDNRIDCYSLETTETKPICMYSGHVQETIYSKISISHDGRYLFSGCMNNMGVIWSTDFPYEEKPIYEIKSKSSNKKELSASDWCADPESFKLATSCDAMPELWLIHTLKKRKSVESFFRRTSSYTSKYFSTKMSTVPIKFETELGEKFKKETEETMNNWDIQNQNLVPIAENLNVTPKKTWNVLFNTKTTSPSSISSQDEITSTHSTLEDSNKIPEAVTPTSSKKRKISVVSPRSLIDHYLVPNSKREKLDTVNEI